MTKTEVIKQACRIIGLVYESKRDYSEPSDGFCDDCPASNPDWTFQHSGLTLLYVRKAVVEKLQRDQITLDRAVMNALLDFELENGLID